ncbi:MULTISPECIES: LptF/LptG family permease [Cellulophaga]|uniref:Lipopolysaccharide export system permease protein n=2 Tax=Cellulophaga TaxID=104264 RepID=A0A1G7L2T1_9FLAO|nr:MULTISPECIES: LptF/LptG family permease [Cellulophaga]QXP52016.1 LptF/LptG family permease [Cellulophaga sp. HaHa_2_1]AIY13523.1 membrane protein [Cellulophaga baltica NN016038]MBA6316071.1 YjgP/YjgQ family permease [Cellulophaga baltica]QXP55658.1 LptF/LptG family permease [Cellulophaga sp. HaHa_2_95]SDF43644.1 lipopolysaccharide export system permease protein [Cellulophaga baltica]
MTILDRYILKRYLVTFSVMLLLFIPIGIMVHLSEQFNKMQDNDAPVDEILMYLGNFSIYIGSMLLPIFLFLSVIFFTSKLASNTEIVAMLSSGISYGRFLRPYIIGAVIVAIFMLLMGMFIVPNASKGFNEFKFKYLKKGKQDRVTENIFNQLNANDFIYVSRFDPARDIGYNFSMEHFSDDNVLEYKLSAANIRWIPADSTYRLTSYVKRTLKGDTEILETKRRLDTIFPFKINDLTPVSYVAETKNLFELNEFIEVQKNKGASNINTYILVKYKRWALPVTAFILTLIAVAVSSQKRRGGMGVNLAFGILVAFVYIFFDRVFGTLAEQSGFSPLLAVIVPNVLFGFLAFYLLQKAKR